jgi:hypothetical protein
MSSNLDCPIDLCTPEHPVELISVGTDCSNAIIVTKPDGGSSRDESLLLLSAHKSELAVVKVILADSVTLATTTPAKAVEMASAKRALKYKCKYCSTATYTAEKELCDHVYYCSIRFPWSEYYPQRCVNKRVKMTTWS